MTSAMSPRITRAGPPGDWKTNRVGDYRVNPVTLHQTTRLLVAQALADPGCRPANFTRAIAVLDKLSPYLTATVVGEMMQRTREQELPSGDDTASGENPIAGFIPFRRGGDLN